MKEYRTTHLVISEDLNHHQTLFAGRAAEWLVEAGFIAAATACGRPEDVLCVNMHGFVFTESVSNGAILSMCGRVVRTGRTSLTVHVKAVEEIGGHEPVDGFLTFVCVDPDTHRPRPHGIVLDEPGDEDERELRRQADALGR
ncbi:MAG: acyl-CoA thioesterase [Actinomycetia bacterium]|nr:acyl-CoA thioesterase [Actinomycetes bacterium]